MDTLLDRLENELNSLVNSIAHYEPIEEQSKRFLDLDADAAKALDELRQHYAACKRLEELKLESAQLDKEINGTLIGLSECRKELEVSSASNDTNSALVPVDELLNYATKITRFTHKQPGSEGVLPWPTEDHIRKGMLATLAIRQGTDAQLAATEAADESAMDVDDKPTAVQETTKAPEEPAAAAAAPPKQAAPAAKTPAKKINLDLFDSDEE